MLPEIEMEKHLVQYNRIVSNFDNQNTAVFWTNYFSAFMKQWQGLFILKTLVRVKPFGSFWIIPLSFRLALDLGGIDYTETSISLAEWPDKKTKCLEDGTLPFGQLPLLQIDGMDIVQSTSILRYLSRKLVILQMNDE